MTTTSAARAADPPDRWPVVLALFGLGNLLNGAWMLASPAHWYIHLPANVPGTGPLNEHFVRDIGCIFFLLGAFLVASIARPRWRLPAMVAASAYSVAHALVHVWDQMRGLLAPDHWRFDVGPIYVGTLLLVAVTWRLARSEDRGA